MHAKEQDGHLAQHPPDDIAYAEECQPSKEKNIPARVRVFRGNACEDQDDHENTGNRDDGRADDIGELYERRADQRSEGKESSSMMRSFDREMFRRGRFRLRQKRGTAILTPLGTGRILIETFYASHSCSP